jgi:DNA polymerase III sliding clamp (beta) subunit (PCNA family)
VFLNKSLARLAQLAADDQTRYAMSGVRVIRYEGGYFRLVATDGRKLAVVQGPSAVSPDNPPEGGAARLTLDSLAEAPDDLCDAVVPVGAWKQAFKLGPKDAPVGIALGGAGVITVASGRASERHQALEGRYPDYETVLPKRVPLVRVRLDPAHLVALCQVVMALPSEDRDHPAVELLLYAANGTHPVGLMAKAAGGITFDALVMPLTP